MRFVTGQVILPTWRLLLFLPSPRRWKKRSLQPDENCWTRKRERRKPLIKILSMINLTARCVSSMTFIPFCRRFTQNISHCALKRDGQLERYRKNEEKKLCFLQDAMLYFFFYLFCCPANIMRPTIMPLYCNILAILCWLLAAATAIDKLFINAHLFEVCERRWKFSTLNYVSSFIFTTTAPILFIGLRVQRRHIFNKLYMQPIN